LIREMNLATNFTQVSTTQQNAVMHSDSHIILILTHKESIHEYFIVFSVTLVKVSILPGEIMIVKIS